MMERDLYPGFVGEDGRVSFTSAAIVADASIGNASVGLDESTVADASIGDASVGLDESTVVPSYTGGDDGSRGISRPPQAKQIKNIKRHMQQAYANAPRNASKDVTRFEFKNELLLRTFRSPG
jgi:hypothetical protein